MMNTQRRNFEIQFQKYVDLKALSEFVGGFREEFFKYLSVNGHYGQDTRTRHKILYHPGFC